MVIWIMANTATNLGERGPRSSPTQQGNTCTQRVPSAWRDYDHLRVTEAGAIFGLNRNRAYAAVRNGDLPSFRIGRRIYCPVASLRRMLGEID